MIYFKKSENILYDLLKRDASIVFDYKNYLGEISIFQS